ncbi:MAG: class I SAM-dependent methyltransferase [Infirmifilum sp.]
MEATGLPIGLWLYVEEVLKYLFDADIYEKANTIMSLGLHKVLRNWVLSSVQGLILDIGCGNAAYIPYLTRKADWVVCVDPILSNRRYSFVNLDKIVGVAEYLPFRNRAFDCATAMFSFRDFMDKARGIFQMMTVVKKGVLILDLFSPDYYLTPLIFFYFGYIAPFLGFLASKGKKGRWSLLVPTLLLMPRAKFFQRIGGRVLVKKGVGLVAIGYLPPRSL